MYTNPLDPHDFTGQTKAARSAEAEAQARNEHKRLLAAGQQSFDAAFREWRASRPEYVALVKVVKREAPESEIELAATPAGCGPNEWIPLIEQRRRALAAIAPAKELPKAQRRFDELDKKYRDLDERFSKAKTVFESEAIREELGPIAEARQTAGRELDELRAVAQSVEAARAGGLI